MTGRTELSLGGSDFGEHLSRAGFSLHIGWDEELANQLIDNSKQPWVTANFPQDQRIRFPSIEAAEEWNLRKKRIIYSLSESSQLAGAIWFSNQPLAEVQNTSTIRTYREARRAGPTIPLAFGRVVHDHFEQELGFSYGVWIDVGSSDFEFGKLLRGLEYFRRPDIPAKDHRSIYVRSGVHLPE